MKPLSLLFALSLLVGCAHVPTAVVSAPTGLKPEALPELRNPETTPHGPKRVSRPH